MQHVISSRHLHTITENIYSVNTAKKDNLLSTFMAWCNDQEEKKFLWLGVGFLGNIGAVLPLTILAIFLGAGHNFTLIMIVSAVNVPVLALNLAAQPTKVTLPALFFAWLINGLIIAYCGVAFFVG